jgi:ABC-2 type transport system ATP-binding protein
MFMTYTVKADGITKSYANHLVLDHVDLAFETGSVLALLGPNGAGKTTMVRILTTLVCPDAGTASVAGHDLLADPVGVRRSISLTGQFAAVDDLLTGRENLSMMAQLRHIPRRAVRARVDDLLATFDLLDVGDRRASTYSGGMRRRLDLAIAMIERPALLFLDEPTAGLDPRSREQLWNTVRNLVKEGVSVLLTTQYLEEADQLADAVAVLDRGRIVARGTAEELKANVGDEVLRIQFNDDAAFGRAARLVDADRIDESLLVLDVVTNGTATEILAILSRLAANGTPAAKMSIHRPSLDDVFLSLTGANADYDSKVAS